MSTMDTQAASDNIECFDIAGPPDVELGVTVPRKLHYELCRPSGGPAKGLLFYVAGCGDPPGYAQNLIQWVAARFGYVAVFVRYHCYGSRLNTGAKLAFDDNAANVIRHLCTTHGVPTPPGCQGDSDYCIKVAQPLGEKLPQRVDIPATLVPPDDEYQNFGIVQALDHLAVIVDLRRREPDADFNNVVLLGTSHGGYIAHILAKLAPGTVNVVIDNSSYIDAPPFFLGLAPELRINAGNLQIQCKTHTLWDHTLRTSARHYGIAPRVIRDLANPEQVKIMADAAQRRTRCVAFNVDRNDGISPPEDKQRQQRLYRDAGFDYELNLIGPDDLDGRVFKQLVHGMDASMRGLCERVLPTVAPRATTLDCDAETTIAYPCYDRTYRFTHHDQGATLTITSM